MFLLKYVVGVMPYRMSHKLFYKSCDKCRLLNVIFSIFFPAYFSDFPQNQTKLSQQRWNTYRSFLVENHRVCDQIIDIFVENRTSVVRLAAKPRENRATRPPSPTQIRIIRAKDNPCFIQVLINGYV